MYSDVTLMKPLVSIKRFIDDGAGFFDGTKRQYSEFINKVNAKLAQFGLNIDEYTIGDLNSPVPFLDIQFSFDPNGALKTDLYVKETSSRSYLYYGSTHPNHVYSSIVYSQCLRLRRIINDNDLLSLRIDELKISFYNSNYPRKMVENICSKVKSMDRKLKPCHNSSNSSILVPSSPDKSIRAISTFGVDNKFTEVTKSFQPLLESSRSFSSNESLSTNSVSSRTTTSSTSTNSSTRKSLFNYVKRTGASLRDKLLRPRQLALSPYMDKTEPCKHRNCKLCLMCKPEREFEVNGVKARSAPGTCISYNVIYLFICKICLKGYIGRTVQELHSRVSEHRAAYNKLLVKPDLRYKHEVVSDEQDTYSLGLHLIIDHNLTSDKKDFDLNYEVLIVTNAGPNKLEVTEHRSIHKFRTLYPSGINSVDPFGIPLLFVNRAAGKE